MLAVGESGYETSHYLPTEFDSDFHDICVTDIEPVLQGSLQVTIHGSFNNLFDPCDIEDCILAALCAVDNITYQILSLLLNFLN